MTLWCLLAVSSLAAQAPQAAPAEQQPQPPPDPPVSIARIQRALQRPPAVTIDADRPVFRVQVFGRTATTTIQEFLGPLSTTPTPHGSAAHQEFLDMVTPDQFRGVAIFTNREAITVESTAFASGLAIKAAGHLARKYQQARTERQREAAKAEVAAALAELERARKPKP